MGLLFGGDNLKNNSLTGALGLNGTRKVDAPPYAGSDFEDGLEIIEIVDGRPREKDKVVLVGSFMPHIPFEFGGTQQIVKEYYPGSSEPVVQVMGPREDDTTIKGILKTKRFKDASLKDAAMEYQLLIDAIRIRGNMVRVTLGEWVRYGFIESTKFEMKRISEISYEIKLSIMSRTPPIGWKFAVEENDPISANKTVTEAAAAALALQSNVPTTMPKSIIDDINGFISGVADQVHKVTSFVDSAISDVDQLAKSANRAIGMIKFVRAYISRTNRNLGLIVASLKTAPDVFKSEAQKTGDTIRNLNYVDSVRGSNYTLAAYLADLQTKFAALSKTVPMFRHRVSQGDSLQKISIKYYNDASHWQTIYDHNKLSSTQLVVGSVLEIPKI